MDRIYDIRFKRLALLLLPTFWRRPLFAAMIYAAVQPLQELHTRFQRWRRDTDYRVRHNGQVCHLQALLNDLFDPFERRITLTDQAANIGTAILHGREAARPVSVPLRGTVPALILWRRGETDNANCDFWINLPLALYGEVDTARLKAVVNTYKPASKRYSINYL